MVFAQPAVELRQVAREKEIDYERWVQALEDAMASAAKKQHRIKEPVRATWNPETGKFDAWTVKKVVEVVEDATAEWTVEEAQEHKPGAQAGDEILTPLSTEGLGRIAAQSAKQVLYQRVREAEREKVYNEYIDRTGEVVNGTVKRFERGDIIVDLGRTEAVVPRSEQGDQILRLDLQAVGEVAQGHALGDDHRSILEGATAADRVDFRVLVAARFLAAPAAGRLRTRRNDRLVDDVLDFDEGAAQAPYILSLIHI